MSAILIPSWHTVHNVFTKHRTQRIYVFTILVLDLTGSYQFLTVPISSY